MTAPWERKQTGAGSRQERGLYFSGKGGVQVGWAWKVKARECPLTSGPAS